MNKQELMSNLKAELREVLNLDEISVDDIGDEMPLFGDEGLGLDSIDALEIILLIENKYGIKIANPKEMKSVFASVSTISDFIIENQK